MKQLKVALFIAIIFVLGACSNNVVEKKNSTQEILSLDIEKVKNEMLNNEYPRIENILIGEFKKELDKNNSIIIDLRTTEELKQSGIIVGAKQIDFYASDFKDTLSKLNKNDKYLIYCRSGGRSGQALSTMKELGFTNVLELQGGMNNWIASGEKTETFSENKNTSMMMDDMNSKTVTLNAKNWEFDQKVIQVKKGQKLTINVNNIDGPHGIAVPELRILGDDQIEMDTSIAGEYEFRCLNYCGAGHQEMTGKIIVE